MDRRKNKLKSSLTFLTLWVVVVFVGLFGWVINIIDLITGAQAADASAHIVFLILRVVGIFVAPLGALLGLFF